MHKKEIRLYKKTVKAIQKNIGKSFGIFKNGSKYVAQCNTESFAQNLLNRLLENVTEGFDKNTPAPFNVREIQDAFNSFLEMSQISHAFIIKIQTKIIKGFEDEKELILAMKMNDQLFKNEGLFLYSFYNTVNCYLRLINTTNIRYNDLNTFKNNLLLNKNHDKKLKERIIKSFKLDNNISNEELGLIIEKSLIIKKTSKEEKPIDFDFYT